MTKPPAPPTAVSVGIPEVRCGKAAGPGEQLIPCQERNVNPCYITGFASRRALPTAGALLFSAPAVQYTYRCCQTESE